MSASEDHLTEAEYLQEQETDDHPVFLGEFRSASIVVQPKNPFVINKQDFGHFHGTVRFIEGH